MRISRTRPADLTENRYEIGSRQANSKDLACQSKAIPALFHGGSCPAPHATFDSDMPTRSRLKSSAYAPLQAARHVAWHVMEPLPSCSSPPHPSSASKRVSMNLRRLRTAKGLSQEQLAEAAEFHRTYVSQLERCATNISINGLARLAQALGVEITELLKP